MCAISQLWHIHFAKRTLHMIKSIVHEIFHEKLGYQKILSGDPLSLKHNLFTHW